MLDNADHKEIVTKTYPVSDQSIQISLIPEGGKLAPGHGESRLRRGHVSRRQPGRQLRCCKLWFGKDVLAKKDAKDRGEPLVTAKTNSAGLAEFSIVAKNDEFRQHNVGPRDIEILGGKQQNWGPQFVLDVRAEASDPRGNQAHTLTTLNSQPLGENVLLAPRQGDLSDRRPHEHRRAHLGRAAHRLRRHRPRRADHAQQMVRRQGRPGRQRIDLPQNVFGSLEIHAYQMLSHGEIIRDSRVVYVQSRDELKIDVQPGQGRVSARRPMAGSPSR